MARMEAKRAADDGNEPVVAPGRPGLGEPVSPSRAVEPESGQAGSEQDSHVAEPRRRVSPLAVVGLVLLAATLAVTGFIAWQVYGTTWLARDAAARSVDELRGQWAAATPTAPDEQGEPPAEVVPAAGEVAWILRIPSLDLEWPIAAGVDDDLLTSAIGWYPSTALPGQVGNFALAGLRLTHGAPFADLLSLEVDDEVIIETPLASYTYRVTLPPSELTVHRDDSWVLEPVPGKPDLAPTEALLTLTTHEDLIDTPDRSVGFGVLENTEPT